MSIIKLLNKKLDRIIFTTPSHNQKPLFSKEYDSFYKNDYSEIEGYDNLSCPRGAITASMAKVAGILGSGQSYFITQGATTAILSAMKAVLNPNDKVLVARNCHKSVFSGLILTGANVDWFMPEADKDWGFYTTINPKTLNSILDINQYRAFIMTSPTYEGINSDIEEISKICKSHNVYLIVDEAHGALNGFSENLPDSAIKKGADISILSLHKTAGALNQTAILNISKNINNIEEKTFQDAVNLFETTSPSYPLLANIEACINFLASKEGKKETDALIKNIAEFKKELTPCGVEFFENENHDPTKIVLRKKGISGLKLSDILFDKFKIEDEIANNNYCLYLTGIGTTKNKLDKLKNAIKKISVNKDFEFKECDFQPFPLVKLQPVETFNRKYVYINKEEALLKISNRIIMPYPPGIGLLYPGEAIQEWHLKYLKDDVEVMI